MTRSGRTADLSTALAAVLAMMPGFIFPFILTWSRPASASDSVVLALSISTTLTSAVGAAIELNTVSEFGRRLTQHTRPAREEVNDYLRRAHTFGVVATLLIGPLLAILYAIGSDQSFDFALLCALMLATSLVNVFSAPQSGMLISAGHAAFAVSLQFLRPLLPCLLLLVFPNVPLVLLPLAFLTGELCRYLLLRCRRAAALRHLAPVPGAPLESRGMIWQSTSAGMSQGAPVVDRVFLIASEVGSVSMYELADKLYFAAVQFLNYGFLLRRVGRWSRLPTMGLEQAQTLFRRDVIQVLIASAVVASVSLVGASWLQHLAIPTIWISGLGWAMVLLLSTPLTLWILSASRLIVIARKQKILLWFSLLTIVVNLVLNLVLFTPFGGFGIILSTVGTRLVSAIAYLAVVWRMLPLITRPRS